MLADPKVIHHVAFVQTLSKWLPNPLILAIHSPAHMSMIVQTMFAPSIWESVGRSIPPRRRPMYVVSQGNEV